MGFEREGPTASHVMRIQGERNATQRNTNKTWWKFPIAASFYATTIADSKDNTKVRDWGIEDEDNSLFIMT